MADDDARVDEDGFEFQGRFYPWKVSDLGKDLMLIDRIAGLPVTDFFEVVEDEHERGRGPILLTLIATSLRAGNPTWTVERIVRAVLGTNLSDVEFVGAGGEETAEPLPPPKPKLVAEPSKSTSSDSSPSSTPEDNSSSETSYATPV